ncbi:MAG TPA: efflux RND transporter periplasmic adaptor subunit [Haliscomenobacter sp.]|nr:efflux RND transporter periplasmic adaptor subunit [Haliscomenobacter sp.]
MHHLILGLVLLMFTACGKKEKTSEETKSAPDTAIPVRVVSISSEVVSIPVQVSGVVSASNEARPAFKTGGIIARILVEEGAHVRKGQLLATLNLTEIDAQVQQAAEAVAKSKRDLTRAKNLYADSVATLEQVQDATTGLSLAEQSFQIAQYNQSYSEIRSPISGKVVKKLMNQGEVVGPGTPVFYILGDGQADWVIKSGLVDRDWARLRLGDRAEVHLDAYPDRTFAAKVSQLADVGNPQSGTFDAEFAFTGSMPRLAVGLIGSLNIYPKEDAAHPIVPIDALVESNGNSAVVYVLQADNTVKRTAVRVGQIFENKAIISSGLSADSKVVTSGAPYLEDGSRVKVIN